MTIETIVLIALLLVVLAIVVYGALNPGPTNLQKHNEVHFRVDGKEISCLVCGSKAFKDKKVQMNTSLATILGWDWANRNATALECLKCGYIMWFSQHAKD